MNKIKENKLVNYNKNSIVYKIYYNYLLKNLNLLFFHVSKYSIPIFNIDNNTNEYKQICISISRYFQTISYKFLIL